MGELISHITQRQHYMEPIFSIPAAITFLSALCGSSYSVNGNLLNIFTLGLGSSSSSKTDSINALKSIAKEIEAEDSQAEGLMNRVNESFSSGQALRSAITPEKRCWLWANDEGCKMLKLMNDQNSFHAEARTHLLHLYSTSYLGAKKYTDMKKELSPVRDPSISVLFYGTHHDFYHDFHMSHAQDGFVGRFIVFEAEVGYRVDSWNDKRVTKLPDGLSATIKQLYSFSKRQGSTPARELMFDADAKRKLKNLRLEIDGKIDTINRAEDTTQEAEVRVNFLTKVLQNTLKLAGLLAVVNTPDKMFNCSVIVKGDQLQWAYDVVKHSHEMLMNNIRKQEVLFNDGEKVQDLCDRFYARMLLPSSDENSLYRSNYYGKVISREMVNNRIMPYKAMLVFFQ